MKSGCLLSALFGRRFSRRPCPFMELKQTFSRERRDPILTPSVYEAWGGASNLWGLSAQDRWA
jgi:hypothetical protein